MQVCVIFVLVRKQACFGAMQYGKATRVRGTTHMENYDIWGNNLAKINAFGNFYAPDQLENSSIDRTVKNDRDTFHNYVEFFTGNPVIMRWVWLMSWGICAMWGLLTSIVKDISKIVVFYHNSPITRSNFLDPTDPVIKGFYCILLNYNHNHVKNWKYV